MRDDHTADIESSVGEHVAQPEHVLVVSDAQVASHLVFLYVLSADDDDNFRIVLQLHEHAQFAVGLEPGQHTTGMIIVVEFSAEFKIKLVTELGYTLLDALRLDAEIFVVVESYFHIYIFLQVNLFILFVSIIELLSARPIKIMR